MQEKRFLACVASRLRVFGGSERGLECHLLEAFDQHRECRVLLTDRGARVTCAPNQVRDSTFVWVMRLLDRADGRPIRRSAAGRPNSTTSDSARGTTSLVT
jgi:hypothetical protein